MESDAESDVEASEENNPPTWIGLAPHNLHYFSKRDYCVAQERKESEDMWVTWKERKRASSGVQEENKTK